MIIMSDGEKIKRKIYISNGLMGKYVGRKKRIQEINATLENCVELMVELYNEKQKLKSKLGSSDVSV